MTHLAYLLVAYACAWAVIFGYIYSIAQRQHALEHDIKALQQAMEGESQEG